MVEIFIALGSNVGDREGNLLQAVAAIGTLSATRITALSPFYDSEPVGNTSQNNFLNAAMKLSSTLSPYDLLHGLQAIETKLFSRTREIHWGPRRMDLDILFYGQEIIHDPPDLLIPHPRLHERRFVLEPLADIAPDFVHPLFGRSIGELLRELPRGSCLTRL